MKKLKLLSLLCSIVIVMGCFAGFPAFATEPTAWTTADGAGTEGASYALDQDNFKAWCEANLDSAEIKGNYILTEDVTVFSGNASEWSNTSRQPSGTWGRSVGRVFSGTFDGNGKTISGICMVAEAADTKVGLFGIVTGEVKNLRIVNSYFESKANKSASDTWTNANSANYDIFHDTNDACDIYTARQLGITQKEVNAARNAATNSDIKTKWLENKNSAEAPQEQVAGRTTAFWNEYYHNPDNEKNPANDDYNNARWVETGSVAARVSGKISNCYSEAIINNKSTTGTDYFAIGGIVGMITSSDALVSNCAFGGSIKSIGSTGGIVGIVSGMAKRAMIQDCLNVGEVRGANRTGALLGWDQSVSSVVDRCMNLSVALSGTEVYGSGANANISFNDYVIVSGIRTKSMQITNGVTNILSNWTVRELFLSELLSADLVSDSGYLKGWSYEEGYVPNPTSHTKIGLDKIFTAELLQLKTDKTSVRVSNANAGLRFETSVGNTEFIPYIQEAGGTVEIKTYITAAKYFAEGDVTEFTKEALDAAQKPYLTVNGTAGKYLRTMLADGYMAFAGSVVNVKDKTMEYVGVGCVTVTLMGQTYEFYADCDVTNGTTVSDVATEASVDTSPEQTGKYKNEITDATGAKAYSVYTQEQYDVIKGLIAG